MTSDLTWLLSWYFRWKYPLNNCSVSLNRSPPACNTRQTVSSSVLLGPGFVFRTPGCPAFAQLFLLRLSPRYCESTVAFFGSVILCSLAAQVHVLFPLPCWIFFFFFFLHRPKKHAQSRSLRNVCTLKPELESHWNSMVRSKSFHRACKPQPHYVHFVFGSRFQITRSLYKTLHKALYKVESPVNTPPGYSQCSKYPFCVLVPQNNLSLHCNFFTARSQ